MKIYFIFTILMSSVLKGSTNFWLVNNGNYALNDMSKICVDNLQQNIFLPYSMGIADAVAITITNKYNLRNCSIILHKDIFDNNTVKIIVLEMLNKASSVCRNSTIYLTDSSSNNTIDICKEFTNNLLKPLVYVSRFTLQLRIEDKNNMRFQSMKITASSSKKLIDTGTCNSDSEIRCTFNQNYTCISRELRCDGNINCGHYNLYDEDQFLCKKEKIKKLWIAVVVGTLMSAFVIYSVIHRIQRCIPVCETYLMEPIKNEENTIVLTTQYLPAAKTYIPMKETETLHLKNLSNLAKSSSSDDVIQNHMFSSYNQKQKKNVHLRHHKIDLKNRYLDI